MSVMQTVLFSHNLFFYEEFLKLLQSYTNSNILLYCYIDDDI